MQLSEIVNGCESHPNLEDATRSRERLGRKLLGKNPPGRLRVPPVGVTRFSEGSPANRQSAAKDTQKAEEQAQWAAEL